MINTDATRTNATRTGHRSPPGRTFLSFLACALGFLFCAPPASAAETPDGAYLDGTSRSGVLLAHGQGATPTSNVVDPLRKALNKELGMHTLSMRMPVIAGKHGNEKFMEYAATFPEAYSTIRQGIDFLKSKGVDRIYLMGYSMGGRMTTGYLSENQDNGVAGYIGVGLLGGGPAPLNTNLNLRRVAVPVIDIYADTGNDARSAEFRKAFVSDRYVQIPISGAQHDFMCCEKEVVAQVVKWLKEQEARR